MKKDINYLTKINISKDALVACFCITLLLITCKPKNQSQDARKSPDHGEVSSQDEFISKLLPAPIAGGFRMDGYWVWGMSVIRDDEGKYHGYASRWPKSMPFTPNWTTNSEIVHCTSDRPEGPYTFSDVVFESRKGFWDEKMTHNPTIHRLGDMYLLYYIGTTYDFEIPTEAITREMQQLARGNQRIGLATSTSPYGPWKRKDEPILEVRPDEWDAFFTSNPAVCIKADGSVLLMYKSTKDKNGLLKLGLAGAPSYDGPYERISNEPIFQFKKDHANEHVEDPYMWYNGEYFELIMKDMNGGITGEKGGGIHATSADGINWTIDKNPRSYAKKVLWSDGTFIEQAAFERPQLLIENGRPTHLFAATGANSEGAYWKFEDTWNMCIPLKRE